MKGGDQFNDDELVVTTDNTENKEIDTMKKITKDDGKDLFEGVLKKMKTARGKKDLAERLAAGVIARAIEADTVEALLAGLTALDLTRGAR